MNDKDFDTAWRDFAKGDAQTTAPTSLRADVMASWDSAQGAQRDHGVASTRRLPVGVMFAAAATVIVVLGVGVFETNRPAVDRRAPGETPLAVEIPMLGVPAQAEGFRLIADPAYEAEAFEVVRLRLPRASLEAIGVTVIGPEVTSLVDVDVLVGGDGLPRAIRGIRPVVAMQ